MIRVGVDVGGTGVKAALVDTAAGTLVSGRLRVPTPRGGSPADVAREIAALVAELGGEGTVGVGFPGPVVHGRVMSVPHLSDDWVGRDIARDLAEAVGRPVEVLNDADAAGLAEMRLGAGRGERGVVMMLTLGTGIGSALFVDGHMVPNLEFGHIEIRGKEGEQRAAASARERRGLSWGQWAERLNEYLDRVDRLVWPDLFILGGGITKNPGRFVPLLRARPRIEVAHLQNSAGIVGAALMAAETDAA